MFKSSKVGVVSAVAALATFATVAIPTTSFARDNGRDRYEDSRYDNHGRDRRDYRHRCGSGDGAVGTIAGGAGGALLGNALGGGTLGTIAGGVGGALVGRTLDKQHTRNRNRERNGC